MASYPNQKRMNTRKVPNVKGEFHQVNTAAYFEAMRELKGSAFYVYCYLTKNAPNYSYDFSPSHVKELTGISDSSYRRGMKELEEKGYVRIEGGRIYTFSENKFGGSSNLNEEEEKEPVNLTEKTVNLTEKTVNLNEKNVNLTEKTVKMNREIDNKYTNNKKIDTASLPEAKEGGQMKGWGEEAGESLFEEMKEKALEELNAKYGVDREFFEFMYSQRPESTWKERGFGLMFGEFRKECGAKVYAMTQKEKEQQQMRWYAYQTNAWESSAKMEYGEWLEQDNEKQRLNRIAIKEMGLI